MITRDTVPDRTQTTSRRWSYRAHAIVLGTILFSTFLLYRAVTNSYFCSDDDFAEVHRSAFEDHREPARIFTTGHYRTFKYRPLNRLLNLATYNYGGGGARAYRLRNLLLHLSNVSLLYVLALLLGNPASVAAAAALLFGVHPLANQTIIGAVDTNSAAHALLLLALIVLAAALRDPRRAAAGAAVAALLAFAAVLFYETAIVAFGILYLYLGMAWRLRPKPAPRTAFLSLTVTGGGLLLAYAAVRNTMVEFGTRTPDGICGIVTVAKTAAMYAAALLLPLDPVLAAEWLGTPFPSEKGFLSGGSALLLMASGGAAVLMLLAVAWDLRRAMRPPERWLPVLFLLLCAALPLVPVLLFTDHPSETYVYLPVAFLALLAASAGRAWCHLRFGSRAGHAFAGCVLVAAAVLAAGTWVRNNRVAACGATARRILSSVPFSRTGSSFLFADAAGEPPSRHYGFYGFRGLDAIANRQGFRSLNLQKALQLASGNELLSAEAVASGDMAAFGAGPTQPGRAAFWVHADGSLTKLTGFAPAK